MAVDEPNESAPKTVLEVLLSAVREDYIEEHGEEPSEEFMHRARSEIVRNVASKDREDHREIYDALADE